MEQEIDLNGLNSLPLPQLPDGIHIRYSVPGWLNQDNIFLSAIVEDMPLREDGSHRKWACREFSHILGVIDSDPNKYIFFDKPPLNELKEIYYRFINEKLLAKPEDLKIPIKGEKPDPTTVIPTAKLVDLLLHGRVGCAYYITREP